MGSKLSTSAFGTSRILRTTCKCSAMMLILSSLPKLGNASASRDVPALPSLDNARSLSSQLSFDTQWANRDMTPLEERVNRHINDILEEAASPKAASPKQSEPVRKSARRSAADASRSSPSKHAGCKKPPIPTETSYDDEDDAQSPTDEGMELTRQNSVPEGDRPPPAFKRIETADSPDAGPRQIDYSIFSFFREWMKEFEREQEANCEIDDPVLKKKIEAAMKKEEWDTVGPGTKAQEAGTFEFPDYEEAIRRLLEFTRRKKEEQALRKGAKPKRARKKPSKPGKKQKSAGGFSFNFDNSTDWMSGAC